jgi:hypothetical protein
MANLLASTISNEYLDDDISISTSSSITFKSPRTGGRERDFIWSLFDDMGPAKTPGHRKAKCKYCLLAFNFAKLNIMYAHIAHQCEDVLHANPNARKEAIFRMHEFDGQALTGTATKKAKQVRQ